MKYGTPISGSISHLLPEGPGSFEKDGRKFAVRFSVPGDQVDGRVRRRKDGMDFLDATIVSPSPNRVSPRCPFAGTCGGCAWQQIDYPAQLAWKQRLVEQALGKYVGFAGDAERGSPAARNEVSTVGVRSGRTRDSLAITSSPDQFYYRNRMDYVFGADGKLGLKEPEKWWSVLDLTDCYLLSPEAPRILAEVRTWAARHKLTFWNQKTASGLLRYAMIREGKHTNQRLVNIVTSGEPLPKKAAADLVPRLTPFASHIVHGRQPSITDLSLAASFDVLHGSLTFEEQLNGQTFAIHPNSFFQTNTKGTELLLAYLKTILAPHAGQHLLDLYCGVGTIGLSLADQFVRVHGVEADACAVPLAEQNATVNNITNATFTAAKVEELVTRPGALLADALTAADVLVLDPPRSGLHPRVLESIVAHAPPVLVYVSCNYRALARELPQLLTRYRVKNVQLFDLFPHTPHVETVVFFERIEY